MLVLVGAGWMATLLFVGCTLFSDSIEVSLLLPDSPPLYVATFGSPIYDIKVSDQGGDERVVSAVRRSVVNLPRRRYVVVLAEVLFSGGRASSAGEAASAAPGVRTGGSEAGGGRRSAPPVRLLPAGALFPDHLDSDGRLCLTWEHGWSAQVLMDLSRGGFSLEEFNCSRFFMEALERSSGDPWALDSGLVREILAGLSFRADRLKIGPAFSLLIPARPGLWLPSNVLREPARAGVDGWLSLPQVRAGYHRWHHGETAAALSVSVGADGSVLHLSVSP